jgi:uncharacterized protein
MTLLKAFVATYPVAAYVGLSFVISWGGALLAIGGSGAMQGTTPTSDARFAYALIGMLAGPSLAGILLTALVSGRKGLREFVSRLLTWRQDRIWYAIALLTAPVTLTMTLFALSAASTAFLPSIFTSDDRGSLYWSASPLDCLPGSSRNWGGLALRARR